MSERSSDAQSLSRLEGDILVKLSRDLSLHMSSRPWPRNMATACLQKGLIMLEGGGEQAEEGVGFGVPTTIYGDDTYFSGEARTYVHIAKPGETVLTKVFDLDTISRAHWRGRAFFARGSIVQLIGEPLLEKMYRSSRTAQGFMRFGLSLERKLGVERRFVGTSSRGRVAVTYAIRGDLIRVEVDLRRLRREGCRKVFILNEQGATHFRRYIDGEGLNLVDEAIGAWSRVDAGWARISDIDGDIGFKLRAAPGSRMYRGRERVDGRLSWAGLAYEVDPGNLFFSYDIEVHGGRRR
jgi:hypothetical protein